eukprot:CAMPEP_0119364886 /NCGR_PEP_ID=MMETSP1334-20130426/11805_1 /TAXON_ID=127549 /ORGANISM="Calcidiscus leptoporus, Strain RCC1130" /LENGTH=52 /DNA_ID=CAMNT_0007380711 /DNA_START=140 /DNA_END=295 /DNA_ORIENTATION=-
MQGAGTETLKEDFLRCSVLRQRAFEKRFTTCLCAIGGTHLRAAIATTTAAAA